MAQRVSSTILLRSMFLPQKMRSSSRGDDVAEPVSVQNSLGVGCTRLARGGATLVSTAAGPRVAGKITELLMNSAIPSERLMQTGWPALHNGCCVNQNGYR